MATTSGEASSALRLALLERSHEFDFFQAVRLCLRLHPGRFDPGKFCLPSQEAVRFHQLNSFLFPPAVIHRITERSREESKDPGFIPLEMTVTVLGLTGYAGLLPWFYTKLLIETQAEVGGALKSDQAFAEFLDLFNHRMISFLYCAWERHRPHVAYEKNPLERSGRRSLAGYLLALLGLSGESLRERLQVSDSVLLGYAGILTGIPRSLAGLKVLLGYFPVPVNILQFQGRWSRLRTSELAVLGHRDDRNSLGNGAILGRVIWYSQASFRIQIGPLSFNEFLSFRPGTAGFAKLIDLTSYFTRGLYEEFDVELVLRRSNVPSCRLTTDRFRTAPRLSWIGWLGEKRKNNRHKKDCPKSVIFRSNDSRAVLRAEIVGILKKLHRVLLDERKLELEWSEDVVQMYCKQLIRFSGEMTMDSERSRNILTLLISDRIELAAKYLQRAKDWNDGKLVLQIAVE